MTTKTHAMRVLDAHNIPYRATEYDASREFHSAEEAAALTGAPPDAVYKTLVVIRETDPRAKPIMVMVPATSQLDLKALAKATGDKKVRMATQREAERLTGMQAGGISALGLRKPASFEILIDARARALDEIHISAGLRGIELALATAALVEITTARYVALSNTSSSSSHSPLDGEGCGG
jgi:Cys-tRNA(Pro)/Cys-tRNA(Cys) deacylase